MWLILILCFLSEVITITAFTAPVDWDVSPKEVEFGQKVTLTCTVHSSSDLRDDDRPEWGVKGLTEVVCNKNKCNPDNDKYSITSHYHASSFALVIRNFSETDLNVKYWCSYGLGKLTKNLTENLISILNMPSKNSITDNTVEENGKLTINITVEDVYPEPSCWVTFTKLKRQIRSEFELNVTVFDITKHQKNVEVLGVVDIGLEQCERRIRVDYCINNELVPLLERNFTIWQELQAIESPPQFEVGTIVVVGVLTLLIVVLSITLVIWYRERLRGYSLADN